MNEAQFDLEIHKRSLQTIDGESSSLHYIDGATMMTYQYPTKPSQLAYCRRDTTTSALQQPEQQGCPSADVDNYKQSVTVTSNSSIHVHSTTRVLLDNQRTDQALFQASSRAIATFIEDNRFNMEHRDSILQEFLETVFNPFYRRHLGEAVASTVFATTKK
jgi:hypothetical protein